MMMIQLYLYRLANSEGIQQPYLLKVTYNSILDTDNVMALTS